MAEPKSSFLQLFEAHDDSTSVCAQEQNSTQQERCLGDHGGELVLSPDQGGASRLVCVQHVFLTQERKILTNYNIPSDWVPGSLQPHAVLVADRDGHWAFALGDCER